MRGVTQREKLESFDRLKAENDKNNLVIHDLVNGYFSTAVRIRVSDYDPNGWGSISVRVSPRAMPLFMATQEVSLNGSQPDTVEVWTLDQILDNFRDQPTAWYWRALMNAKLQLEAKYGPCFGHTGNGMRRPAAIAS